MTISDCTCGDSSTLSDASDVWAHFLKLDAALGAPEQPYSMTLPNAAGLHFVPSARP